MTTCRTALAVATVLLGVALPARAQESTSDWIKRILDPATINVKPYPDSQLNRKITVDTIRYSDPTMRIAVYMAPLDKLQAASDFFAATLGVKPTITEPGTVRERHIFTLIGGGKYPPDAERLNIEIIRSPWVDGKAQITMQITMKKQQ